MMQFSYKYIVLIFLCFFTLDLFAQAEEKTEGNRYKVSYKKSFFAGGNIGLQFGTVTMIDVSPQFGYYILENIAVGTSFTYQYINDRRYDPAATIHVIGGSVFTRLYFPFFNSIFAQGEYEYIAYKTNVFSQIQTMEWLTLSNVLAGVGYRQKIRNRANITLMVLWNFNESQYNLYSNPVIRLGFNFGL